MERLLPLLLSIFGDLSLDRLQKLFAGIAETLIPEIENGGECRTQLLAWLRTGTLDDMIKADPKCVLVCVSYVLLGIVDKDHDHSPDTPVIVGSNEDAENMELAQLLGVSNVSGADGEAAIPISVWMLLAAELAKIIKKALDEWLNK